jgi:hypothetical protein
MTLTGVALGSIALLGIPGEPFTGIGVGLKKAPGWDLVLPTCLTNGTNGYFPMQDAYDEGGYEAKVSRFKAGVAEHIIAEGIKLQSDSKYNQVYIKGYIIGYTTSNRLIYHTLDDIKKTSARSNVVLADNIEEQNPDNMIAVELTNGSYIQQAVNLVDHPENLHRTLIVKGAMKEYKDLHGCIDIPNGLLQGGTIIEGHYFSIE